MVQSLFKARARKEFLLYSISYTRIGSKVLLANEHSVLLCTSGIVKDLDIEIAGGRDDPYIPGNPGVFIVAVRPGSEAEKHLIPGNRITKVSCRMRKLFN